MQRHLALLVLSAGLLVAAACGGGGDDEDATATPTLTQAPTEGATVLPADTSTPEPTETLVPPEPTQRPPDPTQPRPQPTNTPVVENCDRQSYPDVCIAPFPPDLDCGDISYRRFTVLPPDPHGFDGDNDGVGWES